MIFLIFARNLFISNDFFGVGNGQPVRSLAQGFAAADSTRNHIVFSNSGLRYILRMILFRFWLLTKCSGGDIDRVIDLVAATVPPDINVVRLSNASDVVTTCRSTLRGVTQCYG